MFIVELWGECSKDIHGMMKVNRIGFVGEGARAVAANMEFCMSVLAQDLCQTV